MESMRMAMRQDALWRLTSAALLIILLALVLITSLGAFPSTSVAYGYGCSCYVNSDAFTNHEIPPTLGLAAAQQACAQFETTTQNYCGSTYSVTEHCSPMPFQPADDIFTSCQCGHGAQRIGYVVPGGLSEMAAQQWCQQQLGYCASPFGSDWKNSCQLIYNP